MSYSTANFNHNKKLNDYAQIQTRLMHIEDRVFISQPGDPPQMDMINKIRRRYLPNDRYSNVSDRRIISHSINIPESSNIPNQPEAVQSHSRSAQELLTERHPSDMGVNGVLNPDPPVHRIIDHEINQNTVSDIFEKNDDTDNSKQCPNIEILKNINENISNFHEHVLHFISTLYWHTAIPRNEIQIIITALNKIFCSKLFLKLQEYVLKIVPQKELTPIEAVLKILRNPFENIETDYKRFQYFQNIGYFITPTEVILSKSLKVTSCNNNPSISTVVDKYVVISLRDTLKKFFELPNVYEKTMTHVNELSSEKDNLEIFLQGALWKQKIQNVSNKTILPLFFYFDDFGVEFRWLRKQLLYEIKKRCRLVLIAVDEAHCVSNWGQHFRLESRQLGISKEIFVDVSVLAVTATATKNVYEDIISVSKLQNTQVICPGFDRPNLYFKVRPKGQSVLRDLQEISTPIKTQKAGNKKVTDKPGPSASGSKLRYSCSKITCTEEDSPKIKDPSLAVPTGKNAGDENPNTQPGAEYFGMKYFDDALIRAKNV
ncbi:unnamed protein product [Ceutorhynchus assimilis]|uniref:DNA 3'-5' helicase n=1 Tax=Ceutorhynchus assimilis TaxID=467358 RepID=A0A9N9MF73_9CUCU|nr:unnamed protein product [Ceutorhynchus assimilis]